MRPLIDRIVADIPAPDADLLARARQPPATPDRHADFIRNIEALQSVEQRPPRSPLPWPGSLRVATFNAERMKRPEAARTLFEASGAHVGLFSEVDLGMVRSGNGHPLRDMIGSSGDGYLYGVEFVELDLGDIAEMRQHAGEHNARSLHGNALVTPLAVADAHVIPLEESGFWFAGRDGAQRRIGGRVAVAARLVDAPQPLWLASLHLESKTDEADRQSQIRALLTTIDRLAPSAAWIVGGDFNTKNLPRGKEERLRLLDHPERYEPLFDDLRRAGFTWADANVAEPTQRACPQGKHTPPFGKLDWLVARGMRAANPQVLPALDGEGRPISDHDMIAADFTF